MSAAGGGAGSSAAAVSTTITVTVGTDGGTQFGFNTGVYGSVSPANLYGVALRRALCDGTSSIVMVTGVVAQSFFNRVTFKYGASASSLATFVAASATAFSTAGGNSQWTFTGVTFSSTDNGLSRFVIFYR